MDVVRYAADAAALVNLSLDEVARLRRHLVDRPDLAARATDRDCMVLRRFQRTLAPVFAAGGEGDAAAVVSGLNALMAGHPLTPQISGHDGALHLHVTTQSREPGSVADQLIGESLLGLASLVCDHGPERLGRCCSPPCSRVYVDTSPNRSRRYCSDRCATRAHVAAHRARRRAATG